MPSIARCRGDSGERFLFPDVKSGRQRRFRASYIGCCDLKPRYTVGDLNDAIEQLSQVGFVMVETVLLTLWFSGLQFVYRSDDRGGDWEDHNLLPGWRRDVLPPSQGNTESSLHCK